MSASFSINARGFIRSLIAIRLRLLKTHSNRRSEMHITAIISELSRYLNAYNYSNEQMAAFWLKHKQQIAELIPGEGSKSHTSLTEKFIELDSKAAFIV